MPNDQAQTILSPVQVDNSIKADAWEAFKNAGSENELGIRLQNINLPQQVKADLWEAKRKMGSQQQFQVPNATAQAKQVLQNIPQFTGPEYAGKPSNAMPSRFGMQTQANPESTLNVLPAVGGGIGGALGGVPGAALGGGAGEATNQLIRRAAGLPVTQAPTTDIAKQAAIMGTAEGVGKYALSPFIKWLTSSKSAGAALLQQASTKAGSTPVELSAETNKIISDIVDQGKSGGTIPKVITDLLDRLGPSTRQAAEATPGPLTYDEARLFQSNASQLSASESMALKGRMQSLIPKFARSFGQDIQAAADQAGVGAEHAAGMKEYATASARNEVLAKVGKSAVKGAGVGVSAYGVKELIQSLMKK